MARSAQPGARSQLPGKRRIKFRQVLMHRALLTLGPHRKLKLVSAVFATVAVLSACAQNTTPGLQPYNQADPQNYGSPAAQKYGTQQPGDLPSGEVQTSNVQTGDVQAGKAQPGSLQSSTVDVQRGGPALPAVAPATPNQATSLLPPNSGGSAPSPQNLAPAAPRNESLNAPRYAPRTPPPATGQVPDWQRNVAPQDNSQDQQAIAQAPPPLPEYDQPESPGDGYLWTPGYWAAGPDGYYWVNGVWVEPPYVGALWTPGFWGYNGLESNYFWNDGYWGQNVGFYGGLNYGYGYFGNGFYGGAWNGGQFFDNAAYVHLGPQNHSLYNYRFPGVGGVHPGGRSYAQFARARSNGSLGALPTQRAVGPNSYGTGYAGQGYNGAAYNGYNGAGYNGAAYNGYSGGGLGHLAHPGEHTVENNGINGGSTYGNGYNNGGYYGGSYPGAVYSGGYNAGGHSQATTSRPAASGQSGAYRGGGNMGGGNMGGAHGASGGGGGGAMHGGGGGGGASHGGGGGAGGGGAHR